MGGGRRGRGLRAGPGQAKGPGLVVGALLLDHSHRLIAIAHNVRDVADILGGRAAVVHGPQVARAIVAVDEHRRGDRVVEGAVAREQGRDFAEQPVGLDRAGAVVFQVLEDCRSSIIRDHVEQPELITPGSSREAQQLPQCSKADQEPSPAVGIGSHDLRCRLLLECASAVHETAAGVCQIMGQKSMQA